RAGAAGAEPSQPEAQSRGGAGPAGRPGPRRRPATRPAQENEADPGQQAATARPQEEAWGVEGAAPVAAGLRPSRAHSASFLGQVRFPSDDPPPAARAGPADAGSRLRTILLAL